MWSFPVLNLIDRGPGSFNLSPGPSPVSILLFYLLPGWVAIRVSQVMRQGWAQEWLTRLPPAARVPALCLPFGVPVVAVAASLLFLAGYFEAGVPELALVLLMASLYSIIAGSTAVVAGGGRWLSAYFLVLAVSTIQVGIGFNTAVQWELWLTGSTLCVAAAAWIIATARLTGFAGHPREMQ
jgi:hypothetical protein